MNLRPSRHQLSRFSALLCLSMACVFSPWAVEADEITRRPNVILIICDDLNDYIEGYNGHPQTKTPELARLAKSGVRFTQAHCNIPICGPSRASLFWGSTRITRAAMALRNGTRMKCCRTREPCMSILPPTDITPWGPAS